MTDTDTDTGLDWTWTLTLDQGYFASTSLPRVTIAELDHLRNLLVFLDLILASSSPPYFYQVDMYLFRRAGYITSKSSSLQRRELNLAPTVVDREIGQVQALDLGSCSSHSLKQRILLVTSPPVWTEGETQYTKRLSMLGCQNCVG